MARYESDREDLMREATALRRRIELAVPEEPEPIVAGFRGDGALSLYFGPDPVYHFDAAGRLRRAYVDGRLYRTQGETLARLARVRQPTATELVRHDLTRSELAEFLARMRDRLDHLCRAIAGNEAEVSQRVPAEDEQMIADLRDRLASVVPSDSPLAPRFKGKR